MQKQGKPSPSRDCVAIGKDSRHSGESRNPVAVLLNNSIFLDASFRWHDELRHSLRGERGGVRVKEAFTAPIPLTLALSREGEREMNLSQKI